jgi:hypothetical protein
MTFTFVGVKSYRCPGVISNAWRMAHGLCIDNRLNAFYNWPMTRKPFRIVIKALFVFVLAFQVLMVILVFDEGTWADRAFVILNSGLLVIWVGLIGGILYRINDRTGTFLSSNRHHILTFALICPLLVLIEETVAVMMTNTAPLWGLTTSEASITASVNWFETVTRHSVIVFIPQFVLLAIFTKAYRSDPAHVFLMYGLCGFIGEGLAFGFVHNLWGLPFWIFVYGMIAYVPTYVLQTDPNRPVARLWHHVLALVVIVPVTAMWALLVMDWLGTGLMIQGSTTHLVVFHDKSGCFGNRIENSHEHLYHWI